MHTAATSAQPHTHSISRTSRLPLRPTSLTSASSAARARAAAAVRLHLSRAAFYILQMLLRPVGQRLRLHPGDALGEGALHRAALAALVDKVHQLHKAAAEGKHTGDDQQQGQLAEASQADAADNDRAMRDYLTEAAQVGWLLMTRQRSAQQRREHAALDCSASTRPCAWRGRAVQRRCVMRSEWCAVIHRSVRVIGRSRTTL